MKKILVAILFMMSTSLLYAASWSRDLTVVQVREQDPVGGVVVTSDGTCYIRGTDADADKAMVAIALTAKSTGSNILIYYTWGVDPLGTAPGTVCLLSGIAIK